MATTNSRTNKPLSYAYSYGFVGGPLHSRKFTHLMQNKGYRLVKDHSQADIIVAHSAGCWLIGSDAKPKLVIYIGMPLAQVRPSRSWLTANMLSFKRGLIIFNLKTRAKTTYYGITQPKRNLAIMRMAKTAKPVLFADIPTVFIVNQDDPWPQAEQLEDYASNKDWVFISLKGDHDDVWHNPEYYIDIIDSHARLLA